MKSSCMFYAVFALVIVEKASATSFSYAKFETPESGKVLYSVQHKYDDFFPEYNLVNSIPNDAYDGEPFQTTLSEKRLGPFGKVIAEKISRNDDDTALIKELFRPGKLAPARLCRGGPCPEKNIWKSRSHHRPETRSKIKFETSDSGSKWIRFPEHFPNDAPRLGARSRELGMSGKLRNAMQYIYEPEEIPQEIKYITYETITLVPPNSLV